MTKYLKIKKYEFSQQKIKIRIFVIFGGKIEIWKNVIFLYQKSNQNFSHFWRENSNMEKYEFLYQNSNQIFSHFWRENSNENISTLQKR